MGGPVALVDCNNFYASCERLFQLALRGKPVVVLSNNDGCVIARSNEAKALGIVMGDAWHLRRAEFERWGVIVRSSNYTLYGDISARVMRVLSGFTPELEVYSIDEAFLGLSGFADPQAHAHALRATVLQNVGIPVSVGIAPTKVLAKVANRTAKKDPASGGVCQLADEAAQTAALAKMELGDLWGIGHRLVPRLAELGITTPLQLRDACPTRIKQSFNVVLQRLVLELQGTPCLDLEEDTPDRKSIMASRSFGRPVESFDEMQEATAAYVSRAAEKMRRQGLATASIAVFVTTNKHTPKDAQYYGAKPVRLTIGTADTGRLIRAALWGLRSIYRPGYRYKKCGVTFLDLHPADQVQGSLFLRPDSPARQQLMLTVDALNRRYGRNSIRFAAAGIEQPWKLRSERLSQCYTTRFSDILRVY